MLGLIFATLADRDFGEHFEEYNLVFYQKFEGFNFFFHMSESKNGLLIPLIPPKTTQSECVVFIFPTILILDKHAKRNYSSR